MVSVQIDRTECWLEFARAHTDMLNLLCFSVYSRRTSEILTLVELLSRTLLADNCLVALATSLARNLLSPSVIILILIWLIIDAGHRTCPAVLARSCTHTSFEFDNQCSILSH